MPLFSYFPAGVLGGNVSGQGINWLTDTINVALVGSGWTPSPTSNKVWSDVSANEVTGTGYTAGGQALASKTVTVSGSTTTLSGANVTWADSTITARYAVIYKSTGVGSTSMLVGYVDFGSNQSSSAGNFTIAWNAAGIATLPVA